MAAVNHPILVVDDEPANLEMLERFLRTKYQPIFLAEDGEAGVAVLERHTISLILTDQRMPKMDGTELLRRACELQPDAMRVLVTGFGDVDTLTAAINDGHTYQVIAKPINLKMLEMVVQRALEAREAVIRERALFEGFVNASVNAIEQRDPSTAGHSSRVATMTTGLAMVVDGVGAGRFRDVRFSNDELQQIKYASLLHDFGKIGVREAVLVKSHKLPPERLALVDERLRLMRGHGRLDELAARRYRELLGLLNDPTTRPTEYAHDLELLRETGLIDQADIEFLRIESGSLSPAERREIESHVTGTVSFLQQIPWPERLCRVTEIAGAHHERIDGSGYPSGAQEICLEAQMMAICDVYDALVAADRPYKTAIAHPDAVDILARMSDRGSIDRELLDIFIERKVYRGIYDAA